MKSPFVLLITASALAGARADEVDKAFDAQKSERRPEVRVDGSVGAAADASSRGVAKRAIEREEARRREAPLDSERADDPKPAAWASKGGRQSGKEIAPPLGTTEPNRRDRAVRLREFWLLKGETLSVTVRCADGAERSYTYFPKTGRYCTNSHSCDASEVWVQRAVCP